MFLPLTLDRLLKLYHEYLKIYTCKTRNGRSNSYSHINYGDGDLVGSYDLYTWETLEELLFVGGYAWGRLKKD